MITRRITALNSSKLQTSALLSFTDVNENTKKIKTTRGEKRGASLLIAANEKPEGCNIKGQRFLGV